MESLFSYIMVQCLHYSVTKGCDSHIHYSLSNKSSSQKETHREMSSNMKLLFLHLCNEWGQFEHSISCIIFIFYKGYVMVEKGDFVEQLCTQ